MVAWKAQILKKFLADLVVLGNEAADLQLYKTMHHLADVQQTAGWEVADMLKENPDERDKNVQ